MKKIISIDGQDVEFTSCTFCFEGERVDGIYVHQISDKNRDGDCVIGNCCTVPETADEAKTNFIDESPISDSEVLDTVEF